MMEPTIHRISVDREYGQRVTNAPINGLVTTAVTVITMSRPLAALGVRPCPETRNGNPHRSAKTVAPNCAEKCDQRPRRVPGSVHASFRARPTALILSSSRWWSVYGESRTTTISTIPRRTPTPAAEANDTVQPRL